MNNSRSAFSIIQSTSRDSDKGKFLSSATTPKAATPRRATRSPAEVLGQLLSLSDFFNLCSAHDLLDVRAAVPHGANPRSAVRFSSAQMEYQV